MPAAFPPDSVGLVVPQTAHFNEPLALACGRSLPAYDLIYETYGQLNATGSNAVLICHALSGTTRPTESGGKAAGIDPALI